MRTIASIQIAENESLQSSRALIQKHSFLHSIKTAGKGRTKKKIISEIRERIISNQQTIPIAVQTKSSNQTIPSLYILYCGFILYFLSFYVFYEYFIGSLLVIEYVQINQELETYADGDFADWDKKKLTELSCLSEFENNNALMNWINYTLQTDFFEYNKEKVIGTNNVFSREYNEFTHNFTRFATILIEWKRVNQQSINWYSLRFDCSEYYFTVNYPIHRAVHLRNYLYPNIKMEENEKLYTTSIMKPDHTFFTIQFGELVHGWNRQEAINRLHASLKQKH